MYTIICEAVLIGWMMSAKRSFNKLYCWLGHTQWEVQGERALPGAEVTLHTARLGDSQECDKKWKVRGSPWHNCELMGMGSSVQRLRECDGVNLVECVIWKENTGRLKWVDMAPPPATLTLLNSTARSPTQTGQHRIKQAIYSPAEAGRQAGQSSCKYW